MKHLIKKQVIALNLDAGQDAFSIQQQARDFYYHQIAPALEKLFDELSSENEVIHIEKLEIDLGDLGWRHDRFALDKESVYRILKQKLADTVSVSGNSFDSPPGVSYRTREENACLQWLYYLVYGVLPWEIKVIDASWLDQVLHQLATDHVLIEKTKALITNDSWFLSRLVGEHHEEFLINLAEVITARRQRDLIEKVHMLTNQAGDSFSEARLTKKDIWVRVLRQLAIGKSDLDYQEILRHEKSIIPTLSQRDEEQTIQDGIFCQYAGMVLLHPFFTHLFNRLFLLDNGKFKNAVSLEKAVVLLYFIATGKLEAKDYELAVPKILCGMPLNEVINEESFLITETEREEALNLLQAAIDQWHIIRDTSVDGLRESFLVREGKVSFNDSRIALRIESKGIDVLLDHLPWNLSLIKFPWLDKFIHVEWR